MRLPSNSTAVALPGVRFLVSATFISLAIHVSLPKVEQAFSLSESGGTPDPLYINPSCSFAASVIIPRSEEHTSELQSHSDLVCRLLLEKKKKKDKQSRSSNTKDT